MNWRPIPLQQGIQYNVLKDWKTPADNLCRGDIVVLSNMAYSRYDCATVLDFVLVSGETKRLFLHDNDEFPLDAFEAHRI